MWTVSDKFLRTIRESHRMIIRVEVYAGINGSKIYTTENMVIRGGVTEGSVSITNEAIRRRATVRFTDPTGDLTPSIAEDILLPWGNEVSLYRGVQYADATSELVPLGRFGISDVDIDDPGGNLSIGLNVYDRARRVQRAKLVQDYVIPAGTNFVDAIVALIASRVSGLQFVSTSTSYATPRVVIRVGADPWAQAQKLAASIGFEIFFDPEGKCIVQPVPNYFSAATTVTYEEGEVSALLSMNKRYTDEEAFNHYIVTGEATSNVAPVRGEAFDDNPASPTYYRGKYGDVPAPIVTSSLVTTSEQASEAASALLRNNLGQAERLHFNALVNSAHEVGDVVHVRRAKSKVNDRYVLDRITIPLTFQRAMDVTTKVRQNT